jgi:hypothetical protein
MDYGAFYLLEFVSLAKKEPTIESVTKATHNLDQVNGKDHVLKRYVFVGHQYVAGG